MSTLVCRWACWSPADVPSALPVHQWAPGLSVTCWNKFFSEELMLLVDRGKGDFKVDCSSVTQAAPVHYIIWNYRIVPQSVSPCGKGETPWRDAGDRGAESLSNEELCCEQHRVFLLYMNASYTCTIRLPEHQKLSSREKKGRHQGLGFLGFYSRVKIRLFLTCTENERIYCRNYLKSLRNHPYKSLKLWFDKSAFLA